MLARFAIPEHTIDLYEKHNFLHSLGFCSLDGDCSSFMLAQYPAQVSRTVVFHLLWLLETSKHYFFQWPVFDAMDYVTLHMSLSFFYISCFLFCFKSQWLELIYLLYTINPCLAVSLQLNHFLKLFFTVISIFMNTSSYGFVPSSNTFVYVKQLIVV